VASPPFVPVPFETPRDQRVHATLHYFSGRTGSDVSNLLIGFVLRHAQQRLLGILAAVSIIHLADGIAVLPVNVIDN
jgi:hypothetical protein